MSITITYVLGTDNIGPEYNGEAAGAAIERYCDELTERLAERFPEAKHIDVVVDNGRSVARVEGLSIDEAIEREESIIEAINNVANETWNRGNWSN